MKQGAAISRRVVLGTAAAVPMAALADNHRKLRVLAWPGYADPDVVQAFEQRMQAEIELTLVDTDDALWQRVSARQGRDFDIFAVNTAELQRYIAAGLVTPLDPSAIPRRADQLPRFRELDTIAGLVHGGQAYAIPYTYAEMGLIHDRRQLSQAPTSLQALWDPQWRGKVLCHNGGAHNISLSALSLGLPSPFQIGANDWPRVVDRVIGLRRNVLGFYGSPEESVRLFKSRGTALMLANYGSQQVQLLKAAGLSVGYSVPQEGALAWLDCWALTAGARNPALAMQWINYLLEPGPGGVLLGRQGLANTTTPSPFHRPDDRLLWLEPVEDPERRTRLWRRVLAGDRAAKVLAA
ncbi:extracellular solute-binding protein [Hydrogenophaga sp. OTU3427]|uniref:extracellular solute-binding protein n=1 Tax=Hydrogenophaga sp. OTU3427 TaxID=3043856 RepID=UPI00313E0EBD